MKGAARVVTRLSKQSARGRKPERLKALLPDVWALVKPRRGLLGVAFLLMAVSRVCGLVPPPSTKYLIDDVIGGRDVGLLLPLVGAVVGATVVQGLSSFALVVVDNQDPFSCELTGWKNGTGRASLFQKACRTAEGTSVTFDTPDTNLTSHQLHQLL